MFYRKLCKMLIEFKNAVQSLFSSQNSKIKLSEALETVHVLLNGCTDISPGDQDSFLLCIELLLNKTVGLVTEKLLRVPAETDEHTHNFNHELIQSSVAKLIAILLKSMTISTSSPSFNVNLFSKVYGPAVVKLYLTYHENSFLRSNNEDKQVTSLLSAFLQVVEKLTLQAYLNSIKPSLYLSILKLSIVNLTRDKWKSYPVSTIAYQRFIELSEREKLSNELSKILPPVLILVDDFQPTYVVRGLKILQRILLVVPAADMRMYGWAEVVYDALSKKLYDRDTAILNLCLPCLLSVLQVLERDPKKADKQRKLTKYDEIFQIIISNLTMSSENDVLRVIWKHLPSYIEVMGITVLRHFKDLMQLFQFHLEIGHLPNLPFVLRAIETVISVAWIRLKNHCPLLLKQLLTLALRVNHNGCEDTDVYSVIQHSITLLYHCNPTVIQKTLSELKELTPWNEGHLCKLVRIPSIDLSNDEAYS